MVSRKIDLGGSKLTCPTFWIVDQSSPYLFRRALEESFSITCFSRFWISCLVPEIFAIKVGSCVKSCQISRFWLQKFCRGQPPEFLDWDYKADPDIDHVLKFHGNRLSELKDLVVNFKKSRVKHKAFRNYRPFVPGGLTSFVLSNLSNQMINSPVISTHE